MTSKIVPGDLVMLRPPHPDFGDKSFPAPLFRDFDVWNAEDAGIMLADFTALVLETGDLTSNGFRNPYPIVRVLTSSGEVGWIGSKYLMKCEERGGT